MRRSCVSLCLAATLAFACAVPALAWEYPPAKYATFQQYLEFYRSCEDEDTRALAEYIDGRLEAEPDLAEGFDADAYFEQAIADPALGVTKDSWLRQNSGCGDGSGPYDEGWFHAEMLDSYLTGCYRAWRDAAASNALAQQWPERYAAFDAAAWFEGYYALLGMTPEAYMEREGLDSAGFKEDMFAEWAERERGFFGGYCVMVNGTPVQFQLYRDLTGEIAAPRAEENRLLLPVRAVAEQLGLAVDYLPETGQVTCTGADAAVTFTLGSTQYSGGSLETAPYAQQGVTYLPLRALGEALGCQVTWDQEFFTAAVNTPGGD